MNKTVILFRQISDEIWRNSQDIPPKVGKTLSLWQIRLKAEWKNLYNLLWFLLYNFQNSESGNFSHHLAALIKTASIGKNFLFEAYFYWFFSFFGHSSY